MGFQRDNIPLVRSRAESHCRVWDSVPQTAAGRSAKGELKNSPVDCFLRGNALQERAFPYFFPYPFYNKLPNTIYTNAIYLNVKGGAAFTCKACPSLETVETVSKFTLCETLEGFMQGFAPHPTRGSASGLCQRDIIPLETHFLSYCFMHFQLFCSVVFYDTKELPQCLQKVQLL